MVLVNFFISILDRSYVKIKSALAQKNEIFSMRNVILFCCYKSNEVKSKGINIENEFEDGNRFEVTFFKSRSQRANFRFKIKYILLMIMLENKLNS